MPPIEQIILLIPVFLLSLSSHEFAHGYASYYFGDPTPETMGRLTLNPISHLDPIGMLVLIMTQRIGWAKPVPINPRYYSNPRKDLMIVSLAGPGANFLLAVLFSIILRLMVGITGQSIGMLRFGIGTNLFRTLGTLLLLGIQINIALGIFNLLPVPPLDGSKILRGILPPRYDRYLNQLEGGLGMIILLILAMSGMLWAIIGPIVNFFYRILLF